MGSFPQTVVSIFRIFLAVTIPLIFVDETYCAEDKHYWYQSANLDLKESLSYAWNTNTAKNVIIFLGDGMSLETIAASRIYNAGEESYLAWEKFPHIAVTKTYDSDKQVPDSASTATAVFCGVKTNYKVTGVDSNVPLNDCEASLNEDYHVDSILAWAQAAGKDTGFVTTTRVTHATPSALYAHSASRKWECEANMPASAAKCKDIARQLVENKPGKDIKVIMGGGRQQLQSNSTGLENDEVNTWSCYRQDGRKLIDEWAADKTARNFSNVVVQNNEELFSVDTENTDFLMGIFNNAHLSMDWNRDTGPKGQPSLENMTVAAIKILQKAEKGFVLAVEGGLIDYAHHRGHAAQALRETIRFSEAVSATLKLIDTTETLVIVTSDHGHAMTFNSGADRGQDVLGIATNSEYDNIPFTVLSYSTGGPNNMAYEVYNSTTAIRKDPSLENTTDFTYSQQAAIVTDEAQHSGTDTLVYAIGPYAHLLHATHEQNYIAHVAAYAAKIGEYYNNSSSNFQAYPFIFLTTLIHILLPRLHR
ncbi:alkaline phosphatase isoform X1 [Neodiprion pinetum]|uniref:alkaline phosphatase isoform X1 n=2 Tax=Neodiprion pinetum TaxID=441929 RepID=UPI001EDED19F|nr:alkaline phosphatase-like isoform X1 [Neodiprion pinetum]